MKTVLDQIKSYKLEEIRSRMAERPFADVEQAAKAASAPRGFTAALKTAKQDGRYGLICEIKKASPSKGLIREDFDPPVLARDYERGGAVCLSVLTDTPSFQGADSYLTDARRATRLPALRKDFMFDPYQVVEARGLGADCILIIMAAVSDSQAGELEQAAKHWGMDVLIEIHNRAELDRALALESTLIGINNRDLHTFETNLAVTERLAPLLPADKLIVSESGLRISEDLARLAKIGVSTFLIGESLMRHSDVEAATRALAGH